MSNTQEAVNRYLDWLDGIALSENTKRTYKAQIKKFGEYLQDKSIEQLVEADILKHARGYKAYLLDERKLAASTVNVILAAVDHFFEYLGFGKTNVKREEQAGPDTLSEDEQRKYLKAIRDTIDSQKRAIGMVLMYTGLRLSEAARLDVEDLSIKADEPSLVARKYNNETGRSIPLDPRAIPDVQIWLLERALRFPHLDGTGALFLNRSGDRLSTRSIDQNVRDLGELAGIDSVSPSTLRNSCLANLVAAGKNPIWIANFAGYQTTGSLNRLQIDDLNNKEQSNLWLILEDETAVRLMLERFLSTKGISTVSFENGDLALAWLRQVESGQSTTQIPEMAVIDIRLPGSYKGYEIAGHLRESKVVNAIKIVLMSAYSYTDDEMDLMNKLAQPDLFLQKPLPEISELFKNLQALLDKEKESASK